MVTRRSTPAAASPRTAGSGDVDETPTSPAPPVLAHHEYRYWRLLRGDEVVGHVGHLDEIEPALGVSLVEAGGRGAALAPGTLSPDLHAEVKATLEEEEVTRAALDDARQRWRQLALSLSHNGMNVTSIARALGISRAAVDKLIARARADDGSTTTPAATGNIPPAPDPTTRVEAVQRQLEQATNAREALSARRRRLAAALQDAGHTNRDVAHLMAITEARVSQLAPRDGSRRH